MNELNTIYQEGVDVLMSIKVFSPNCWGHRYFTVKEFNTFMMKKNRAKKTADRIINESQTHIDNLLFDPGHDYGSMDINPHETITKELKS